MCETFIQIWQQNENVVYKHLICSHKQHSNFKQTGYKNGQKRKNNLKMKDDPNMNMKMTRK